MTNKSISFKVRKQHIFNKLEALKCSSNTINYITAEFEFDDEWAKCDVIKSVWSNGKTQICYV